MTKKPLSVSQALMQARIHDKNGAPERAFDVLGDVLERFARNARVLESLRALNAEPDDVRAYCGLAEKLAAGTLYTAALASLERALRLSPNDVGAHIEMGNILRLLGRQEDAARSYRRALSHAPLNAQVQYGLGTVLHDLGSVAEAEACYLAALKLEPRFGAAHLALTLLKTQVCDDPRLALMTELAEDTTVAKADRVLLHSALGKAWDDLGEPDRAFGHFAQSNRLRRSGVAYSIAADRRLFARVRAVSAAPESPPQAARQAAAPDRRAKRHAPAPVPIFIIGMPRSGTTLIEQVLASHPKVHAGGELELLSRVAAPLIRDGVEMPQSGPTPDQLAAVREGYFEGLSRLGANAPFITDKMPQNFLLVGLIATAIPEARIVHLTRDPRATCWSIFRIQLASERAGYALDLVDIGQYYRMYADLMAHWHATLPGRILDLGYESFTENQEAETRRLLDHCGLDWDVRCLSFHETRRGVSTASTMQVRRGLYRGSSEDWRRYEAHLGPLLEALERPT